MELYPQNLWLNGFLFVYVYFIFIIIVNYY